MSYSRWPFHPWTCFSVKWGQEVGHRDSLEQAGLAPPPSAQCCDLSSEGEMSVPSLRNLGAMRNMPNSRPAPTQPSSPGEPGTSAGGR